MEITAGQRVHVMNARGERSERVTLTGVVAGRDFPVVWVATLAEVDQAEAEGRQPQGAPWPVEDVVLVVPSRV